MTAAVWLGTSVLISKWEPYERVFAAGCIFNWWASGISIIFTSKQMSSACSQSVWYWYLQFILLNKIYFPKNEEKDIPDNIVSDFTFRIVYKI